MAMAKAALKGTIAIVDIEPHHHSPIDLHAGYLPHQNTAEFVKHGLAKSGLQTYWWGNKLHSWLLLVIGDLHLAEC